MRKMLLTDLQKVDNAMVVIYGVADMILKEPDRKENNMSRARTIIHTIDLLREQLTEPKKENV